MARFLSNDWHRLLTLLVGAAVCGESMPGESLKEELKLGGVTTIRLSSTSMGIRNPDGEWSVTALHWPGKEAENFREGYWVNTSRASWAIYRDLVSGALTVVDSAGTIQWQAVCTLFPMSSPSVTSDGAKVLILARNPRSGEEGLWQFDRAGVRLLIPMPVRQVEGRSMPSVLEGDASVVLGVGDQILKCSLQDGACTEIRKGRMPAASPRGSLIAFVGEDGHVKVVSLSDPKRVILSTRRRSTFDRPMWCSDERYLLVNEGKIISSELAVYRIADGRRVPMIETNHKTSASYGCVDKRVPR